MSLILRDITLKIILLNKRGRNTTCELVVGDALNHLDGE